jgi:DNA polymerase Ligase (LigD)
MPRFVVLLHETPPGYPRGRHYDLMLEQAGVLWTWAAEALPVANGAAVPAERLPDHRLDYLDYEGEVAGNRGCVTRVDRGQCELLPSSAGQVQFRLQGEVLRGALVLTPPDEQAASWRIRLATDASAGP